MKTKRAMTIICTLLALLILNAAADAQMRKRPKRFNKKVSPVTSIGVRVGNDFEAEQLLLGGHLWMPVGIFWKFAPSFEYYFVEEEAAYDRWQFNADFMFKPRPRGAFYIGGGLAANYLKPDDLDSEIKYGGNLLAGLDFGRLKSPSIYPYIQARYTIMEEDNYFSLLGGINLILK
jgi:hypothetical protein